MIPQVETQTTTYVDDNGKTVSIDPIVQKGVDGQNYTTQGGKVIKGYFAKKPSNASGYMSPFGKQGAIYVKDMHNGYKATFERLIPQMVRCGLQSLIAMKILLTNSI